MTVVLLGLVAATAIAATVTQAPTISGNPKPGSTLTASSGSWTPSSATPTYNWLRCDASGANCVGIDGACGRTYLVRTADVQHTLRVRLTATESSGSSSFADSDPPTAEVRQDPYQQEVKGNDTCTQVKPTGPAQGSFNSGTQTPAGTTPSPVTTLEFIKPFPVVRIAGRFKGRNTKLTKVTVRTPRGTRIRVSCKGHGCPYRRRTVAARLLGIRSLQRTYRPKAQIEIRITQAGKIGKYTRVRTRRGKAPLRLDRCLRPGKAKPVRCPSG